MSRVGLVGAAGVNIPLSEGADCVSARVLCHDRSGTNMSDVSWQDVAVGKSRNDRKGPESGTGVCGLMEEARKTVNGQTGGQGKATLWEND